MTVKVLRAAISVFGIFYIINLPAYIGLTVYKEQYLGLFLAFVFALTFLSKSGTRVDSRGGLRWHDILLAFLSVVVFGNIILFYPELITVLGFITWDKVTLGAIAIFVVLEAARRILGLFMAVVGLIFILYVKFAYLLPGILNTREISWERILIYLYLDPASLLGIPLNVAATIVFAFILFGQCLFEMGAGEFLSNLSLSLLGKYRGGPAKVAVVSSALFGTLSGSASANVATTGCITIPLMKRVGYSPVFAGAVEAAASTGGLIMPPVMAATAFIMAEFLAIPYSKVAISAAIPAILYYVGIYAQVHLRALKDDLRGLPPQEIPSLKDELKKGWIYIFPVAGLLYFLFWLYFSPEKAALYAAAVAVLIGVFKKKDRLNLSKFIFILESTGKMVVDVAVICGLAGFIIGTLSLSGLGLSLSRMLVEISGGNVLLLLVLAAMANIILGMGMPIVACYIMLVILIAPALVEMGIQPLAAHFFIFYFGAMSFLTPPVAIAAYVAAGIAGADPIKTGFQSVRLAIAAYVVPFIIVRHQQLLMQGSVFEIIHSFVTAVIGIVLIAIGVEGFLIRRLSVIKRVLIIIGGVGSLIPGWESDLIGLGIGIPILIWEWRATRVRK